MGRWDGAVESSQSRVARLRCLSEFWFLNTPVNRKEDVFLTLCCFQSNQRVDLYSWRVGCGEVHTSLQGHTRVIRYQIKRSLGSVTVVCSGTRCGVFRDSLWCVRVLSDLDWSWFEPEFLVTSSVDTYIYIWDTRSGEVTRVKMIALIVLARCFSWIMNLVVRK